MDWETIRKNASVFQKEWKNRAGNERAEAQWFIEEFLKVFGVERKDYQCEYQVTKFDGSIGYIDGYVKGKLIIEMKSASVSKDKKLEDARDQAIEYYNSLSGEDELPQYILISNFNKFILYEMGENIVEKTNFTLNKFKDHIRYFDFLIGKTTKHRPTYDVELNKKAAYGMARLHQKMKSLGYEGHELHMYLARLLFCLFADDTGVFGKDLFYDYVQNSKEDGSNLGDRLADLFEVLDKSPEQRQKQTWISDELLAFQYINGGLFKERLSKSHFDAEMRSTLLKCCDFNWGQVKPEIFGSLFQETMDEFERHEFGAHYTSEENILKIINPLFLDDLKREFNEAKKSTKLLERFYEKLHTLKFFDPACGCGNFLIVAYRELRLLEMEVLLAMRDQRQTVLDITSICKVNVDQFYGIEIEEFPAQIAKVGMWLCDHLMNEKAGEIFSGVYPRIPLKESATIICDNALRIDWNTVVPNTEVNYILGNPPYLGSNNQNESQKEDISLVFKDRKNTKSLDYVAAWYQKAAEYMQKTPIECAFVSTNSITQGGQVQPLWEHLIKEFGLTINFAYRTFIWKNAAKGQAHVYCVIIGFDMKGGKPNKWIVDEDMIKHESTNISPYLLDETPVFVASRTVPICNIPPMTKGSIPVDDGHLSNITHEEYEEFCKYEPIAKKYLRRIVGADEFLGNIERWCLWLVNANPSDLAKCPRINARMLRVKEFRLKSKKLATQKYAQTPAIFMERRQPTNKYLLIPLTTSENREYVPMSFVEPNVITTNGNATLENATLYQFGVLTSRMHMAWMRGVCGRLEGRYRYSNTIVYNTFVWPEPTDKQKESIEKAAQAILDARALYPDSSFADLYDPKRMPIELRKAHTELDKAVEKSYNRKFNSEDEIYAFLLDKYVEKIEEEKK